MKHKAPYPVDLHCHTQFSDGDYSIQNLLTLARHRGLSTIAVTDHDTTRGLPEACARGKEMGIDVIPGIEISAYDYKRNRKAHIIGLFIDPNDTALDDFCTPVLLQRHEASWHAVTILKQQGYEIDWDVLRMLAAPAPVVYRQHIMHYLMKKGYITELFGTLYHHLFNKINGSANFPIHYIDVYTAVRTLRSCGALPVLAHPGLEHNEELIPELVCCGLAGCEVRHPSHSVTVQQKLHTITKDTQLFVSGGSDFHGHYEKHSHAPGDYGITGEEWAVIRGEHHVLQENGKVIA